MTNFISAVLGEVKLPTNIVKEYLSKFRGVQKFKAYILSWLDGWIYNKLSKGEEPWVYVIEGELAKAIGCCRDTVSRHLKELLKLGIVKRLPYKRYPTDNIWAYTIDFEKLQQLIAESLSSKNQTVESQKLGLQKPKVQQSLDQDSATYTNTSSNTSKAQPQPEPVSTKKKLSEDTKVIKKPRSSKTNRVRAIKSLPTLSGSLKSIREHGGNSSTPPTKPTLEELGEVRRQLRELRVNPDECAGVIVRCWANVQGAITYLKSATWANNPIAVFINACKKGLKPETQQQQRRYGIPEQIRPPNSSQLQALEDAKNVKKIHDWFFSGDGVTKVVLNGGIQMMPWWDFLGVT